LINGEFKGALAGHWGIGPHNVDDIILNIPEKEKLAKKQEIIKVVSRKYHPPRHRILKYAGNPI